MRILALPTLAVVAAVSLAVVPTGTAAASANGTMLSSCSAPSLKAAVGPAHLELGRAQVELVFQNTTRNRCMVGGYPGLILRDGRHRPLRVAIAQRHLPGDPPPHAVILGPGDIAYAYLAWIVPNRAKTIRPSYLDITMTGTVNHQTVAFAPGQMSATGIAVTALAQVITLS